ncbi:SAM-dependent methyltransferase [Kitasatospora sp. NPDC058965]|uniref:SAM-dependent methyltransferase n=1 Tax=Kitasatospora sp. NPDC058965 TaxID=3346682 RepID=UPI003698C757
MTTEQIPEGVGRTAIGVARVRALESARPDRLFDDPYAAAFVRADGPPDPAPRPEPTPARIAMARHLIVRTRFFDDYLLAAARGGCTQVVLPAAGLDTRAYRLDWPAGTRVFELDLPEVLAFKERVLAEQGAEPTAGRTALAVDLREEWTGALTAAGFDPARPTVWLAEGLLVYLGSDEVAALLTAVTALSAPGSRLAITHGLGTDAHRGRAPQPDDPSTDPTFAPVIKLWRGGLAEDPVSWLGQRGWRAERHDRALLAVEYGRPADYLSPQRSFVTAER